MTTKRKPKEISGEPHNDHIARILSMNRTVENLERQLTTMKDEREAIIKKRKKLTEQINKKESELYAQWHELTQAIKASASVPHN